jgi:hypothetical protein
MIGELFDQQEPIAGRELLNELLMRHLGEIPCNGADSFSPAETWTKVIQEQWREYMVQQHVEQQLFDYHGHSELNRINLVGILLCYNDKSFGPGLVRGSAESVVNVHQGRGVVFPPMISKS